MNTILYVWAVVAMGGSYSWVKQYDWKLLGEYAHPTACHTAARTLGVDNTLYRCVSKFTGGKQ